MDLHVNINIMLAFSRILRQNREGKQKVWQNDDSGSYRRDCCL